MNNINLFLQNEQPENINQAVIGYDALFYGYIVKSWFGNDLNSRYEDYNKMLIYHCVMFYKECWDMRCQITNDEEKQRNRVENWYRNKWNAARNNKYPKIQNFA